MFCNKRLWGKRMFNGYHTKQLNIWQALIASVCCTMLILSVIISALFIANNSVHNCNCHHENCNVCIQIEACMVLLRVASAGIVAVLIYNLFPFISVSKLSNIYSYICYATPVSLKIKLLN